MCSITEPVSLAIFVGMVVGNSMLGSADYKKLQKAVSHLQYSRENMIMKQPLGEGCFGEVPLM